MMKEMADLRDVSQMTLEQKVGQMIMCGFEGTEPSAEALRFVREHAIGGVIYFARNVRDTAQVARMSRTLQTEAKAAGQAPLWIAIDQEGGMVARITEGVALMPGAMAIAAGGSTEAAYEAGSICGRELKALGINLNFAPVLDVNNNPENPVIGVRSFGENPERVGEFGVQFLRGLQETGVAATAKHFPGHGDTSVDSHLDLPVVAHDCERIEAVELRPFRQAIEAGVDAIMSAHIVFPAFESGKLPVTLSKRVLTGLLREELGFDGIIMTDCMEMNAIADHFGTEQAAVMAVEAGADLILISHRHDRQLGALESIIRAVRDGRISEERIDRSVRRLLALKKKRGVTAAFEPQTEAATAAAFALVGCEAHREAARRISEASTTLVRDEKALLPVSANGSLYVISVEASVHTQADETMEAPLTLGRALRELGCKVTEFLVPQKEVGALRHELVRSVRYGEQVIVASYNAYFDPAQTELIRGLITVGKEPIVVSQRSPYDLLAFPEISTYIAAYESRPLALRSAAKVLVGKLKASGKLPVSLGCLHPSGTGGRHT